MKIKKEINITYSGTSGEAPVKTWLKIIGIILLVMVLINAGIIVYYNIKWKPCPTVSAEVLSVYKEEDIGKKCRILYYFNDKVYQGEVKYAAFSFAKAGKHINIKVNPDRPLSIHYTQYNINGLIICDFLMFSWCGAMLWAVTKTNKNKTGSFNSNELDNTKCQ